MFGLAGCRSGSRAVPPDAEPVEISAADVARAKAFAEGSEPMPDEGHARELADSVERRALREGAGARAGSLHAIAARLRERIWRIFARDADSTAALEAYRAASRDVVTEGSCEAAVSGALLLGEVRRDPVVSYVELYRAERRYHLTEGDAGRLSACRRRLEESQALLAAFRPASGVLARIDDELAQEGTVSQTFDAGLVQPSAPPRILRIESWPAPDAARVVIVLDRPAGYRIGDDVPSGANPGVFLDFDGVSSGSAPADVPAGGVVTQVRTQPTSTGTRVWLTLDGQAWRRVFELSEPYRVIVDVARRPPGMQAAGPRTVSRLVLDPGHGGTDRGAHGSTGLEEKDVTLDIARRVAPVLAAHGIEVLLTRAEDVFVSLEERTARANSFGADLFVSIHCNASESRSHRAIETYVLDTNRDEIAARVAARENATTQAASGELAAILGDMRMADSVHRSRRLAQLLLRASTTGVDSKYGDAINGGMHAAGFYVLVGARMPAVLFESSYISNPLDERRLASGEYRQVLADAIANAVRAYREGR